MGGFFFFFRFVFLVLFFFFFIGEGEGRFFLGGVRGGKGDFFCVFQSVFFFEGAGGVFGGVRAKNRWGPKSITLLLNLGFDGPPAHPPPKWRTQGSAGS